MAYPDGRYHRERRKQFTDNGRAQPAWEAPQVFEGQLSSDDLQRLRAIFQSAGFASVRGTVGEVKDFDVVHPAGGGVIPHENIEFLTAVVHNEAQQVFEISDFDLARQQVPLRLFLDWVKKAENLHDSKVDSATANNCSWAGPTSMVARPVPAYAPQPSQASTNPIGEPVMVEFVVNPDGTVAHAEIKGHSDADTAARVLAVVNQWKFQPARFLGIAVAARFHASIAVQPK